MKIVKPIKYLFASLFLAASIGVQAQEFEINQEKSHITFISYTKMLGINAEVAGTFKEFTIRAVKTPSLSNSSVELNIVSNSINTDNNARDNHLKKEDFLNEEKFKNITFKSSLIKDLGNQIYTISGMLRVKDKDLPISFKLSAEGGPNNSWHIKGDTMLSRSAMGINYQAPFFLPEVKDEVKAIFDIWLKPKTSK